MANLNRKLLKRSSTDDNLTQKSNKEFESNRDNENENKNEDDYELEYENEENVVKNLD